LFFSCHSQDIDLIVVGLVETKNPPRKNRTDTSTKPISGLDSWNALKVIKILHALSRMGCTILLAVHQPSVEVLGLFDELILLANGEVVFQGAVSEVEPVFTASGIPFPALTNVADYAMLMAQVSESPAEMLLQRSICFEL
jgi:energy-coupling factor transporter ATP-binding protein EcfA2